MKETRKNMKLLFHWATNIRFRTQFSHNATLLNMTKSSPRNMP